jgi:hypothetical protein
LDSDNIPVLSASVAYTDQGADQGQVVVDTGVMREGHVLLPCSLALPDNHPFPNDILGAFGIGKYVNQGSVIVTFRAKGHPFRTVVAPASTTQIIIIIISDRDCIEHRR